jgi:hypothetical protein
MTDYKREAQCLLGLTDGDYDKAIQLQQVIFVTERDVKRHGAVIKAIENLRQEELNNNISEDEIWIA